MCKLFLLLFHIILINGYSCSKDVSSRIIGGREADITEVPYQAATFYRGVFVCGGAILSPKVIVTAGQCLCNYLNITALTVGVGSSDIENMQHYDAKKLLIHEEFASNRLENDIGLVWLVKKLKYGSTVYPIVLASPNEEILQGELTTFSGWGYVSENSSVPQNMLRLVELPAISIATCKKVMGNLTSDKVMCAGYVDGEKGPCWGDNGGPLSFLDRLFGIATIRYGCPTPNTFSVFTKMAYQRAWVHKNVWGARVKNINQHSIT